MCVRYTLHDLKAAIEAVADALGVTLKWDGPSEPRYNVALTQIVPVVAREGGEVRLRAMRWGLPGGGPPGARRLLPNARGETITKLPAFRTAAARRRCLVPANGFYEFKDLGKRKEPYVFSLANDRPFAFAGLWDPPLEDGPPGFCIVTTEPNALVAPVHNRMPVVLADAMPAWLGEAPLADPALAELLRPAPPGLLKARPVNAYVNNTRHEGPRCLADPDPAEPELF